MKSLTALTQIIIIAIIMVLVSKPSSVAAQAETENDNIQAAALQTTNIVGGQPAEQGEWGWQVLVRPGAYLCGGSLVAADWVLTAAHCVFDNNGDLLPAEAIHVTVGETYRGKLEGTEQLLNVSEIFAHEAYDEWSNNNDIALLHLATPALLNEAVAIVPLLTNEIADLAAEGNLATVTGWGTTEEGGNSSSALMEVSVPVVANELCNRSYGIITDNMICGGLQDGGKDSCQGDSGGPLVVADEDGNWYLAGVVSFGYGCARADFYGVYTRVSQYVTWIQDTMATHVNVLETPETETPVVDATESETPVSVIQMLYLPVVMR